MIRPRPPDQPPSVDELIRWLQHLRPCWQPERVFEARSELVHDLRRLARDGSSGAPGRPAGPSERERRLTVVARSLAGEVDRLQRRLAQATRPRARRRAPDDRQLVLSFTTERTA
jgi:hypothetical protein